MKDKQHDRPKEKANQKLAEPRHKAQDGGTDASSFTIADPAPGQQNEYIETLLKAIPDLISVMRTDGTILDVRSGSNFQSHFKPKDCIGKNIADLLGEPHGSRYLSAIKKAQESGNTVRTQYDFYSDGTEYFYEARISPLGEDKILALERNISEFQESRMIIDRHTRFKKLIDDISTAFVKSKEDDLKQVLEMSLAELGNFLEVQRGLIFGYNADYSWTYLLADWHTEGVRDIKEEYINVAINSAQWPHDQILANKIIQLEGPDALPAYMTQSMPIIKSEAEFSAILIPVLSTDKVMAALAFQRIGSTRVFPQSEIDNLRPVANMLGEIIHKQRIHKQLTEQVNLQEMISSLALKHINLPVEQLDDAVNGSLKQLAKYVEADQAMICFYDQDYSLFYINHEWYADEADRRKRSSGFRLTEEINEVVERHKAGKIIVFEDTARFAPKGSYRVSIEKYNIKSTISMPLMDEDHCMGFISFNYTQTRRAISQAVRQLLDLYAQLIVNVYKRKKMEESLLLEKERAEQASKAKSLFLANVSHEIRTPLNGVIGFTELLLKSNLGDSQKRYAENIAYSGNNLMDIINDVLDMSKIEADKLELLPMRTDLIELIERTMDIVKIKAMQKSLNVIVDIPPDFPRYATIDPLRLNQILSNLLSNAAKFTEKGEIELRLRYEMIDELSAKISFFVRDTGTGIKPEEQDEIFKAFSQLDASVVRKHGGTGLGLVIASRLAKLMDSHIHLESVEGVGSTFSFEIRAKVERGMPLAITGKQDTLLIEAPTEIKLDYAPKILIAEDNAMNLSLLQEMLVRFIPNAQIYVAIDGLDTIRRFKDYSPDIILMDVQMPHMDGISATKEKDR